MLAGHTLDSLSHSKGLPSLDLSILGIVFYFRHLRVGMHEILSLFGFFTFITIAEQLLSGTMLAFSLVPEPMLIPLVRDEEDMEDLYIDDFF